MHGHLAQVLVDFFAARCLFQVQIENRHGNVRRRNANGVAGQLALEHRQRLGGSCRSTRFGDDHVQRSATTTTTAFMEVVDQVLVVGVGMHSLDMTVDDAVLVIDRLQHRHDCVGGAGRRRYIFVVSRDLAMVDAMNDVLQLALARRSQHNTSNTRALEVLTETLGVAPFTDVVDQQSEQDARDQIARNEKRIDKLQQETMGEIQLTSLP